MAYSQVYITTQITAIEILHTRFSNDYCNFLKRRNGRNTLINKLTSINNIVGKIIDILTDYTPYGNSVLNNLYNGLTEAEIKALIDYSYTILNKYSFSLYLPDDPNIYL